MNEGNAGRRTGYLVFDVDGTICFDGRSISEEIAGALREAKAEGPIGFASARPIRDLVPVLPEDLRDCLLVGGNGAFVRRPGEPTQVDGFPHDVREALDRFIDHEKVTYLIDGDWNYSTNGDESRKIYGQLDPGKLAENVSRAELKAYAKAVLFIMDKRHHRELAGLPLTATVHPIEGHIDQSPVGIDKGATVVRALVGLDYVAFGNDVNDRTMFAGAVHSLCIGDSSAGEDADQRIRADEVAGEIREQSRALR